MLKWSGTDKSQLKLVLVLVYKLLAMCYHWQVDISKKTDELWQKTFTKALKSRITFGGYKFKFVYTLLLSTYT